MTKSPNPSTSRLDLVVAASRATGISQADCHVAVRAFFNEIARQVAAGHEVQLRGLATFYTRIRVSRPARNPRTGEPVMLPRRRVMLARMSPDAG